MAIKDKSHLELFVKFIGSDVIIHEYSSYLGATDKWYRSCKINITGSGLCSQLYTMGIHSNKTFTASWPKALPNEFIWHYLRGVFDGDGTIGKYHVNRNDYRLGFVGTYNMLSNIQNIFAEYLGKTVGSIYPTGNVFRYVVNGNNSVRRLCKQLYHQSTIKTRLNRKYETYLNVNSL